MDVFKIEQQTNHQIGSSLVDSILINASNNNNKPKKDLVAQVNCDQSAEFNLHFFDTPDDSSTQGGFSDPGSVESNSVCSPPPIYDSNGKLINSTSLENNNCSENNRFFQGMLYPGLNVCLLEFT